MSTATAPATIAWPRTSPEVSGWAAGFDPRLTPYLEWLGTVIVACTGDPDRLDADATTWDDACRSWRDTSHAVQDRRPRSQDWQGNAADTFRAAHDEFVARLQGEAARLSEIGPALRLGSQGLRVGRQHAVQVTETFLSAVTQAVSGVVATSPAVALALTQQVIQQTFEACTPAAVQVVTSVRETMAALTRRLEQATPDAHGVRAWLDPELTRRGVRVFEQHEIPVGATELTMGVVGASLNIPAEVARQRGRMANPLMWALSTWPAGVLRNVASYADLPLSDNLLYQLPATVGVNAAAVYGSNGLMKVINRTPWFEQRFGAGTMYHDAPAKLLVNNSITSLLLAGKPLLYQVVPGMRPELITDDGEPRSLTNRTALANNGYDVAAIGVPAAVIFGYDAYAGLRGQGMAKAVAGGMTTAGVELVVGGVAVAVGEHMDRPPEPLSLWQRGYDAAARGWQRLQEAPAVIATGAAFSALGGEARYLGATIDRLQYVPKVGEVYITDTNSIAVATEADVRAAQQRYQHAVEVQRQALSEIGDAGRAIIDTVGPRSR